MNKRLLMMKIKQFIIFSLLLCFRSCLMWQDNLKLFIFSKRMAGLSLVQNGLQS